MDKVIIVFADDTKAGVKFTIEDDTDVVATATEAGIQIAKTIIDHYLGDEHAE